ncbi:MAG: hypothetical protein ACFFCS_24125 [Candidatus Hodarchaeota archaeon]
MDVARGFNVVDLLGDGLPLGRSSSNPVGFNWTRLAKFILERGSSQGLKATGDNEISEYGDPGFQR